MSGLMSLITLLFCVLNTVLAVRRCTSTRYCQDGHYCCNNNRKCCKTESVDGALIAGIVVGAILLIAIILVVVCYIKKIHENKTRVVNVQLQDTGNNTVMVNTAGQMNPGYGPSYGQYGPPPPQQQMYGQEKAGYGQQSAYPPAYPPPPGATY